MRFEFAENLSIDADISFLNVERLDLHWKPNEHATLLVEGFIDNKISYYLEQLYNSRLIVSLAQEGKEQHLFSGYIVKAERNSVGNMDKISLLVLSGSCLLDRKEISRSFQSIEKTYSETVKQAVESSGGNVICTKGIEDKLNQPVIQFEESTWQFAKRLASHLGSSIIPDIETGNPNLWFGMRKGKNIPDFSIEQYIVNIKHNSCGTSASEIIYQAESRDFYKIGDRTTFFGEKVIVVEVSAIIERGELIFTYFLKKEYVATLIYQRKFAGLSLSGNILDTKEELIKVALDIDHNSTTGNYYYPWYPKTGNALYTMPESGARIELYFPGADEKKGFITDCFPEKKKNQIYEERSFVLANGDYIQVFDNLLCFSKGGNQSISLDDGSIAIGTAKQLQLSAEGKVLLRAKRINVCSEDEINIYKS